MPLSEVTILFGQRAGEIEKARDYFTQETRRFVEGVRGWTLRVRHDPWATDRVRLALAQEIESEGKTTGYLSSQYALARNAVKFVKRSNAVRVADITFGFLSSPDGVFFWEIWLEPTERYAMLDAAVWHAWNARETGGESSSGAALPGACHFRTNNSVRFVQRSLSSDLTEQVAYDDVKTVFEFMLGADVALQHGTMGEQDE